MAKVAHEVRIQMTEKGEVSVSWPRQAGPLLAFGLFEVARKLIHRELDAAEQQARDRVTPATPNERRGLGM